MNRFTAALAITASALALAGAAQAQNLVINNARIIVKADNIIEKGSLVVKDGKIVSVTPGPAKPAPKGVKVINGTGMTLIAGYIDDHRHLVHGGRGADGVAKWWKDDAQREMMELLESGVTTVQSGGDNSEAIMQLRERTASGQIKGPRIISSAQVPVSRMKDEATVRAAIDDAINKYHPDSIAEVHFPIQDPPIHPPTEQELKNVAAGIDEAAKHHVPFQIHTSAVPAQTAAIKIGAKKLVHTPHFGWMTDDEAKLVRDAHANVSSCSGFGVPVFGIFNKDNKPTFRDGHPWPKEILDGEGNGREAGYKTVNGRTLFDNGVDYGYCTDTTYYAPAALAHELKALNLVFSPLDLIKVMGQNSADFIDMGDKIGTLEPGKFADILVLGANPLDGYWNFLTAEVVIKGGVIMVDKRGQPNAGKPISPAN